MADLKISIDMRDIPAAVQATRRFERQIDDLAGRLARGAITSGTYQKALNQLSGQYRKLGVDISTAKSNIMTYGRAAAEAAREQQALSVATQGSARSLNRSGVITQQAGYQLGDFIVQVQSGTNWMVAFGQQATQVAGTLTLLQGKWVLIGSVLGVTIPLLTAIGAVLMRTRQEADESSKSVDDLEESLKSLDSTLRDYLRTREAARMGITVEELLGTKGIEDAEQKLESARKALEDIRKQREAIRVLGGGLGAFEFGRNLFAGGSPEDLEAAALARLIEAENRLATLRQKQQEEQFKTFSERLLQYEEEIALQREIAKFGRDSAQVQQLEREQALAAEIRRIDALEKAEEITTAQAIALREQARLLSDSKDSASGLADALRDAASAMSALTDFSAGLDRALAVAAAKVGALREGANAAVAGQIAGMRVDLERRMNEAVGAGVDRGIVERMFGGERGRISQLSALEEERVSLQEGQRRRGGGGRDKETVNDYLAGLEREAETRKRLLTLSDDAQRVEERRFKILEALRDKQGEVTKATRERIEALIKSEEAVRKAMEAEERREQLMNSIQGNLEAGFMAMIDGSKSVEDAFKSMIRAILVDIAQQAIVKPIASGITSFLFPGRASGGSMMAGKPYLVGESGPELVIPSRGSTVANANLTGDAMGGGQAVVINQTFQFSANGDDSVKRIIAAEAPKIAALTQKQIVDQRRRGGQMRSVFG